MAKTKRRKATKQTSIKRLLRKRRDSLIAQAKAAYTPPVLTEYDIRRAGDRGALRANVQSVMSILRGMIAAVPPGKDGLLTIGVSLAQANALISALNTAGY